MSYQPDVTADDTPLEAWIDIKNEDGFLEVKPMIKWLLPVTKSEAEKFSYHLLVVREQRGNHSRSTQKGQLVNKAINQPFSVSSSKTNYVTDANYEFTLKIYEEDKLIIDLSKSL